MKIKAHMGFLLEIGPSSAISNGVFWATNFVTMLIPHMVEDNELCPCYFPYLGKDFFLCQPMLFFGLFLSLGNVEFWISSDFNDLRQKMVTFDPKKMQDCKIYHR